MIELIPLSGVKHFKPRPQNRHLLGVLSKISHEQPRPFYVGVPQNLRMSLLNFWRAESKQPRDSGLISFLFAHFHLQLVSFLAISCVQFLYFDDTKSRLTACVWETNLPQRQFQNVICSDHSLWNALTVQLMSITIFQFLSSLLKRKQTLGAATI